jgi:hypothetical protein
VGEVVSNRVGLTSREKKRGGVRREKEKTKREEKKG